MSNTVIIHQGIDATNAFATATSRGELISVIDKNLVILYTGFQT